MNRDASLRRAMTETIPWDVVVIGGGATGLGTAVDAASRGYRTLWSSRLTSQKQLRAAVQNWRMAAFGIYSRAILHLCWRL